MHGRTIPTQQDLHPGSSIGSNATRSKAGFLLRILEFLELSTPLLSACSQYPMKVFAGTLLASRTYIISTSALTPFLSLGLMQPQ